MKKLIIMFAIVAMIMVAPAIVKATPIAVGDPVEIGSWQQGFNETGVGPFNKMEMFSLSGNSFEAPAYSGLASGWSGSLINSTYALATGTALSNMTFNIMFLGSQSVPLSFDFLAWNGTTVLERAHAIWNGGGWVISSLSASAGNYNRTAVPEPATMLLLGFGLVGLAGVRRFNK